jgi:hypothetical protein
MRRAAEKFNPNSRDIRSRLLARTGSELAGAEQHRLANFPSSATPPPPDAERPDCGKATEVAPHAANPETAARGAPAQ